MKKFLGAVLVLLLSLTAVRGFGYRVDENEIRSAEPVQFVNYQGIWHKRETVTEVMTIGQKLAYAANDPNVWANFAMKYRIIHAASDAEPDKFAADIFSIEPSASVDNIYNVRLIISAYLQTEYGYGANDGMLLARYITYYNAIHRGDTNFFAKSYKSAVMKYLLPSNAGMSRVYSEWPGKTRIVIPLSAGAAYNNLTSVDTRTIADNAVNNDLRNRPDRSVTERSNMVELQQHEVNTLRTQASNTQQQLDQQRQQERQQQQQVQQTRNQLQNTTNTNQRNELQQQLTRQTNELHQTQTQVAQTQTNLQQTRTDISNRQQNIDQQRQQIQQDAHDNQVAQNPDQAVRDVRQREDQVATRETNATQREQQLDQREQQLRDQQLSQNVFANRFYYMKINQYLNEGYYHNDMFLIDPATMAVIVKSPFQTISGDHYDLFSKGVVVIGYLGSNYHNHKLVLLDAQTLKPLAYSTDIIFWRSFVQIYENYIYAIVMQEAKFYLGKFDENLQRVALSDTPIVQDTFISFYGNNVYVNGLNNTIISLDKTSLTNTGSIRP